MNPKQISGTPLVNGPVLCISMSNFLPAAVLTAMQCVPATPTAYYIVFPSYLYSLLYLYS